MRSSGSEVIHDTLQITAGDQNYWLTRGWDNITVSLEDGQQVTFEGCAIDIALPARNADGTQDLKFSISNIDGVVSDAIDENSGRNEIGNTDFSAVHLL